MAGGERIEGHELARGTDMFEGGEADPFAGPLGDQRRQPRRVPRAAAADDRRRTPRGAQPAANPLALRLDSLGNGDLGSLGHDDTMTSPSPAMHRHAPGEARDRASSPALRRQYA